MFGHISPRLGASSGRSVCSDKHVRACVSRQDGRVITLVCVSEDVWNQCASGSAFTPNTHTHTPLFDTPLYRRLFRLLFITFLLCVFASGLVENRNITLTCFCIPETIKMWLGISAAHFNAQYGSMSVCARPRVYVWLQLMSLTCVDTVWRVWDLNSTVALLSSFLSVGHLLQPISNEHAMCIKDRPSPVWTSALLWFFLFFPFNVFCEYFFRLL